MKQRFKILLLLASIQGSSFHVPAQLWQMVGGGLDNGAKTLFPDTATGLLYVGGDFNRAGDTMVCKIATWDGNIWNKVGLLPSDTVCPYSYADIISVTKWNSNVFASGAFMGFSGSQTWQHLANWNGISWDTLWNLNTGGLFETTNGQMLAMSWVLDINGIELGRVIRWNGVDTWESFCDSLPMDTGNGFFTSSEYFQGQYVFAGNFQIPNGYKEIASWDGNNWHTLDNGIPNDTWVNKLKVFKEQLFVGGEFYASVDFPSSYLACWDGNQWYNPFPLVQYMHQVRDMQVIDGQLYILGTHFVWDGSGWQGPYELAHYDGQEFCSFGGMDIFPRDIAGLNGHIYVTTTFTTHPDPYHFLAEWLGGDSVDICISQPVHVNDPVAPAPTVSLSPNPTKSTFSLTLPKSTPTAEVKIQDLQGKTILPETTYHTGGPPIDVSMLASGLYFVQVKIRDKIEVIKLVKQH